MLTCLTAGSVLGQSFRAERPIPKAVILNGFRAEEQSFSSSEKAAESLNSILVEKGYRVSRFKVPYDDLVKVGQAMYGAKIVVYYGHGVIHSQNIFNPTSYNVGGFKLGTYFAPPAEFRREIRFAADSLVFLPGSCFASGNCQEDRGKVERSILEKRMAVYAEPFLYCGAAMVLSGANEAQFLKSYLHDSDVIQAYQKAARRGKETVKQLNGFEVRYREDADQLVTHSVLVTKPSKSAPSRASSVKRDRQVIGK